MPPVVAADRRSLAMDQRTTPPAAPQSPQLVMFDAIMPSTMAARAEQVGVKKASSDSATVLVLAVLGGAFISFGAIFATTVSAGWGALPYGVLRLLAGLVFSVGLILVVVGGAELFTGNNLIVMAWASGKVKTRALALNWLLVFAGNFVGAFMSAVLMFYTTQYEFGGGSVGLAALSTADGKLHHGFVATVVLGIMCNALVCLAIWMSYSGRSTMDKIISVVPPVSAFVAAGFEHCIANIYYVPVALLIKAGASQPFWDAIQKTPADYPDLTWSNFLVANLVPATIGNIIGGALMVGAVYWFVYLRRHPA
jgi:formate transporter FocA